MIIPCFEFLNAFDLIVLSLAFFVMVYIIIKFIKDC